LIPFAITAGASRVASGLLCLHAVAITPAGLMEPIRSYFFFHQHRPSPITRWVGSCINRFEACSAFTHVTACTLAESPSDPFHRKLRQLRCLRRRFDCYRVERSSSRAGVSPAVNQRLSRRTRNGDLTPTKSIQRFVRASRKVRSDTTSDNPAASNRTAVHEIFQRPPKWEETLARLRRTRKRA
jgi:hypothetical protein